MNALLLEGSRYWTLMHFMQPKQLEAIEKSYTQGKPEYL
jgi:hypothetical protein